MKLIALSLAVTTGLFGFSTLATAASPAAELRKIEGSVLVNKGESYRTALEGMPLQVGNRLMVMDGSSMVLVYEDGCIADFAANQIVTVEAVSTCEGGSSTFVKRSPLYADPMGGGGPGPGSGGMFGLGPTWTAGIVGGLGLATGVAISQNSSSGDSRISGE